MVTVWFVGDYLMGFGSDLTMTDYEFTLYIEEE